jgi:ParB family chromosome partitioning protein
MDIAASMSLPIADIAIGDRIGFYNEAHALRLGVSFAEEGQRAPIQVKRNGNAAKQRWTLVAGLHRLRGAESIGWAQIGAIQVADAKTSANDLRRLELSENLTHRYRRPIERAIMMVEQARLEEALDHPGHVGETRQQRGARIKNSASVTITEADDWRTRTAKAFGCSLSLLEKHQRIYRAIYEAMPELAQALNDHPLGESLSAMSKLAALPLDEISAARLTAAKMLLSRDDWKSMADVLVAAGLAQSNGNRVDPEKLGSVMMDAWMKMPPLGRRAHIDWLAEKVTPGQAKSMVATFNKRGLL